jgi:hypothetical protein
VLLTDSVGEEYLVASVRRKLRFVNSACKVKLIVKAVQVLWIKYN